MKTLTIKQAQKKLEKLFEDHSVRVEHSISRFPGGKTIHNYSIQIGVHPPVHSDVSFDYAIDYYFETIGFEERNRGDYSSSYNWRSK